MFKLYKNKKNRKPRNEILNICGGSKITLKNLIDLVQRITKKKIRIKPLPFQRGDMYKTHGNNKLLMKKINNHKFVSFENGLMETLSYFLIKNKLSLNFLIINFLVVILFK